MLSTKTGTEIREICKSVTAQPPPLVAGKPSIPTFEFTTLDFPAGEQFIAWRESYAPMIDLKRANNASVAFAGKQVLWDLGSLAFFTRLERQLGVLLAWPGASVVIRSTIG